MSDDKLKALQSAISQIERNFGKGSVMRLGDEPVQQKGKRKKEHEIERQKREN